MDRTDEFLSLLKNDLSQKDKPFQKHKFYEEIFYNLKDLEYKISRTNNYKSLLIIDRELGELIRKSTNLLDSMKISKDSKDLELHFEGIKVIINRKIFEVSKKLNEMKNNSTKIELEPQRPISFKKVVENQFLEQESKNIVESAQYEETRQRLLKIETVQKAIHENLLLQDERIDNICISQSSTGEIYEKLKDDTTITNGSIFKRAAFTIILCLSFVIVFLHFFYRK